MVRRLWSLIPGAALGLIGIYDTFIKPLLPSDWPRLSLAVSLPVILGVLFAGLACAALLTYHELRITRSATTDPVIRVESGATDINAPGATFTVGRPRAHTRTTQRLPKRKTRSGRSIRTREPKPPTFMPPVAPARLAAVV